MKPFRELRVWQEAHRLTLDVYRASASLPREELYGLTSQMRRAASSIPANIAEGCGRDGDPELARFMRIAMGSASELEYHVLLAHDLKFLADADYERLTNQVIDVKKMLAGFIQKLQEDTKPNVIYQPATNRRKLKAES